ncbi:TolC family protein [Halonatronum saccharophilum]|uniref:TolC family protein n=1 Tax=Halonatronum saccharophilum TaxID=150060 RepID=UPI00048849B5|nr:TolC family protein [Halonatronum saccharophilum]
MNFKGSRLLLLVLISLLFFTNKSWASEITFQQVVEGALETNSDIIRAREEVEKIERDIEKVKADLNWQVDLSGSSGVNSSDDANLNLSLGGDRSYLGGLRLRPEVYIEERDVFEGLSNELGFKFNLSRDIYPRIPSGEEKRLITLEYRLEEAKRSLDQEISRKLIYWLEGYFDLIYLKKRVELDREQEVLARDNLDKTLARQKIGEAGEEEILTARIQLMEGEYSLRERKNNYEQRRRIFYNELRIEGELLLSLDARKDSFKEMEGLLEGLDFNLEDRSNLLESIMENNSEFFRNKNSQKLLEYDFQWSKVNNNLGVSLNGSYDSLRDDWSARINVTYNIFDGGQRKLEEEDFELQSNELERNYREIIERLELDLDTLINDIELSQMNLKQRDLRLDRANLEEMAARQRLERGLINEVTYEEKRKALEEARLSFKEAEDRLLISKLRLLEALGLF